MNVDEHSKAVVAHLSAVLAATRARYESERHAPGFDPDKSDDYIKAARERIDTLSRMREQFEEEMAKPL